ncbi:hypothetical protein [uncultured Paraglaciecola sp.]|nr:hypothetical protein [uncultured Paraglaciecola sp.]
MDIVSGQILPSDAAAYNQSSIRFPTLGLTALFMSVAEYQDKKQTN